MDRRRLPIGIQTFREMREDGCYYVDKTAYIRRLVDGGSHYFLSRPRRFGKSLFLDTLKELFEGNEALFEGLHIHGHWEWSVRHPVLRLELRRRPLQGPWPSRSQRHGAARCRRAAREYRCKFPDRVRAARIAAGRAARARRTAGGGAGRRVRQADPGRPGSPGGRPRQPRLPAGSLRGHQVERRPRALRLPHRSEQVLQGEPVLRAQQPSGPHPGPALLGHLRLYRSGPRCGVRTRAPGARPRCHP